MKMTLSRIFAACVILLIATVPAFAAPMYEVLHSFLQGPYFPASPLVQATDGNFYGTTEQGGVSNNGTIFRMTPAGAFTTLVEFTGNGASNKGRQPDGVLVQGSDGNFYGTTYYGGVRNFGTIFKMTPAGVLTTLVEFSNNAAVNKGAYPQAGLVLGTDGNFYGTTSGGGTIGSGTVFKMTGAGVLTTLLEFNGTTNKGSNPQAGLMQGSDGNFYGTTYYGGVSDFGTIFKMTPAGVLTTLVEFTDSGATNGSYPYFGTLVQGSDGNFYGMTSRGGANGVGTVFKMTPAGVLTTLVEFTWNLSTNKGGSPYGGLVQGSDGNFYGTTNGGGSGQTGTAFKMTPAGVLTTLVEFGNTLPGPPVSLSSNPRAALVQGSDGNFYGTVSGGAGGASGGAGTGGAIFKMTAAGALTTLVKLPANSATYGGRSPQAELVQGTDGNFYGTTYYGGANELGTIFKMTPAGLTTTLIEFTGNGSSNKGASPQAGLVQGRDGNFYGTTSFGGANGYGTVFKMTPAGGLTTLVEFTWNGASNKGTYPNATLIQGSDDNFYGTTTGGGASNFGTVFKMTPAGALTTLVEFDSTNHIGLNPESALVQGVDGNYFGTTYFGGTTNFGTVFKITPTGVLTTLVEFTNSGATNKGAYPKGLIQGSDGNFYGTTWGGGASAFGTVFKMTPAGVLTTLVEFAGNATPNRGSGPNGLVQGSDGNFYGTTYWGGDANTLQGIGRPGTIFVMTPTGELTTLVDLAYWPNGLGAIPYARLIKGADNSFYGTTQYGGSGDGGTVFKVDPLGAPINNADLASLVASPAGITPIFAPGTTSYTLSVSNATASMTVTPAVASNDAQVQVNGVSVASGTASGSINLAVGFNVITVNVTALDNFTTKSYSIFVRRASLLNNNADLTSLVPSPGPLAPGFSNSITSYTESVPNSTASMTVTPTVAQANATVKVNGTTVASGTASGAIVLNVGTNTITTVVTAQDGVTTKTYAIIVTRAGSLSNNSDLASLVPSTGTLVPGFSSGTLIYTEGVSNATASMTVTPTVADSTATVTVNGFAVTSGTASGVIALNVGANVITTMVTAQDGVTTKTYTVTVMRATPPSNNADLSSLLPSAGTLSPAFSNTITSYTESVPNATASMAVTPTVAQANATVTVNGTTVASGTASGSIALNVGANIITTVVTAQDGVTTKNYTITITRANPVSNNADLASLVPSTGTPAPVFSNTITSYTESVPNATASMTVTPTVAQANATVKVNGTAVASGTASGSIALNVGANVITTVATAQDGVTTKTYMITVTRAAALSNNADLASLLPSAGTLAPAFASGTLAYTDSVTNATASITVTPTVAQAGATVKVNGTTVASGSASAAIALAVGVNPAISIVVTAQDGITAKTYTLTVTRAVALSNNADLASLLPSAGTLAPAFASGTLAYTASVSNATASITITPTVAQANATVKVNGTTVASGSASAAIALAVGVNPAINIAVTAQDGVTVKAYTLTVTRAAALSNNADLASLVPSAGTLAPSFASGIFNYTATVAKSALYYTVTPTVAQAGATVTVNGTAVTSGTASGHIPLSIGSNNVITIAVTAPAGGSPQIYTITVTRASVVPSRDWNGDAKPDLVFQNNAGQLYQWALDGTGNAITFSPKAGINSFAYLYTGGLGDWRVVGVADVNGDGIPDLVFQNGAGQIYAWFLDGTGNALNFSTGAGLKGSRFLYTGGLGDWRVTGVADVNGDGNPDLVFQNGAGQVYAWFLDGTGTALNFSTGAGLRGSRFLYTGGLGDWRVVGVADVNGDGNPDLVFQNAAGQLYAWFLNGTGAEVNFGTRVGLAGDRFLYTAGLGDWRVAGIMDVNGDNIPDLVFQNNAGQLYAWFLDGSGTAINFGTGVGLVGSVFLYTGGLGDWRVR